MLKFLTFLIKLFIMTLLTVWLVAQCTGHVVTNMKDCTFNNEQVGCEDYYKPNKENM